MRILGNESGVSALKVWIIIILVGAGIHVGIKYVSMKLDYERMLDTMNIKASAAQILKDEEIRSELVQRAKELDLPLTGENFLIIRDEDKRKMTIKTAWDVEVHYFGGVCGSLCIQEYHFEPEAEEGFTKK
jgi:hypothetical protein